MSAYFTVIFHSVYSTVYMTWNLVASWKWVSFAAETFGIRRESNCAVSWE